MPGFSHRPSTSTFHGSAITKSLLLFALVLFKITNVVAQAELNLPYLWFLCDNGLTIDATVTNTTDTGITYQWYELDSNGQYPYNPIANEINPTITISITGRYKVIATLSDNTELSDEFWYRIR